MAHGLHSAEVRWFWRAIAPPGIEEWFARKASALPPGRGERTDLYVDLGTSAELGVKLRGGKGPEVKGRLATLPVPLDAGPFRGPIERWCKWTADGLVLHGSTTVAVPKVRLLRKYEIDRRGAPPVEVPLEGEVPAGGRTFPARGCNVEWTAIRLAGGDRWWTLCFESFGEVETLEPSLRAVAAHLAALAPPPLPDGTPGGYPAWLALRPAAASSRSAPKPLR